MSVSRNAQNLFQYFSDSAKWRSFFWHFAKHLSLPEKKEKASKSLLTVSSSVLMSSLLLDIITTNVFCTRQKESGSPISLIFANWLLLLD